MAVSIGGTKDDVNGKWYETFFPAQLVDKNGNLKVTENALKGKEVVGLYFSARWCGPCRRFTPILAQFYESCVKKGEDSIQIVFVSSDQNQEIFQEYLGKMPWLAVPFGETRVRAKLSEQCKVQGIPSLVVVDGKTGAILSYTARADISPAADPVTVVEKWLQSEGPTPPNGMQKIAQIFHAAVHCIMGVWMALNSKYLFAAALFVLAVYHVRQARSLQSSR